MSYKHLVLFIFLSLGVGLVADINWRSVDKLETQVFLDRLDELCEERWCLSDFQLKFSALSCDSEEKNCILYFDFSQFFEQVNSLKIIKYGECEFTNINSIDDFYSADKLISRKTMDTIDRCVSEEEELSLIDYQDSMSY